MKMEVLAVQQQYQSKYNIYGSSKVRDWTSTLSPLLPLASSGWVDTEPEAAAVPQPTASIPIPYLQNQQNYHINNNNNNHINNNNNNNNNTVNNKNVKNSIMHHNNKKTKRTASTEELLAVPEVMIAPPSLKEMKKVPASRAASAPYTLTPNTNANTNTNSATATVGGSYLTTQHTPSQNPTTNLFNCDDIDAAAVEDLSLRLLDELRAAKQRHLTCTEVSLPCDLTLRIAAEIIRVSAKEPCGVRGCTIYIEFEDEPNNSRRIAELKLDPEMVSTFEIYLTLRQDHRGWTSLLPQFMKSLARTITISPTFTITKHKLYSSDRTSYSYGSSAPATISATATATATTTAPTS